MQKTKLDSKPKNKPTWIAVSRIDLDQIGMGDRAQIARTDVVSTRVGPFGGSPAGGGLADALSGPLGDLAVRYLRVRPRQTRSVESVERILTVAIEMTFHHKAAENISIEKISASAGVTPQAAYRYFKDADELVKTGLRLIVVRECEVIVGLLSKRVVPDGADLARTVVAVVLDVCEKVQGFPPHMQEHVLREYRQVGYDASSLLSELICKDVDVSDIRHSLDVVKLAVAFTAIIAVATSFLSKKIAPLRGGSLESMLATLFLTVLESGGSSSEAFREMGSELDVFWKGQPH